MKSIILRAHEVLRLQTAGEVLVVRKVKDQPVPASALSRTSPARLLVSDDDWVAECRSGSSGYVYTWPKLGPANDRFVSEQCPLGKPTERRWVREAWNHSERSMDEARAITEDIMSGTAVNYQATFVDDMVAAGMSRADATESETWETWRPSIHMPRWASRDVVEIAEVQAKQVQAITEAEAIAAGVRTTFLPLACADGTRVWYVDNYPTVQCSTTSAVDAYGGYFETVHGPDSWNANPWVWLARARMVEA